MRRLHTAQRTATMILCHSSSSVLYLRNNIHSTETDCDEQAMKQENCSNKETVRIITSTVTSFLPSHSPRHKGQTGFNGPTYETL